MSIKRNPFLQGKLLFGALFVGIILYIFFSLNYHQFYSKSDFGIPQASVQEIRSANFFAQADYLSALHKSDKTLKASNSSSTNRFSIIWLSDTQTLAYHGDDDVFLEMGKWIKTQQAPLNIRYVVQTGDLVDNGFQKKQWDCFETMLQQFYGTIPYLPIAGNHDLGVKLESYDEYLKRPYVRNIATEYSYKGGRAVYAEFQVEEQSFLIVGAGWNSEISSANWITGVLRSHPNHVAILLVHSYINADGTLSYQGDDIRELIVAKNPNVRLVLSGHVRGNGYRYEEFDDDGDGLPDRSVHAMLYNYQGYDRTNSGQLRILTFDIRSRSIHVSTYSPFTDRYYRDETFKKKEFDLTDAF